MELKITETDAALLVRQAIEEDIKSGDVTSRAIFSVKDKSEAVITSREEGTFCGIDMARYLYAAIDAGVLIEPLVAEGASISDGRKVVRLAGPTIALLSGERIALNFIQRMSGIATKTRAYASLLEGTSIKILDTRKTLPGYRLLDKYAVQCGGGTNHRMGLYDMVMIKDNHIKAAGSIGEAVRIVKEAYKKQYTIEVETRNLTEVEEAAVSNVDVIMLDNMAPDKIEKSIKIIDGRARIEVSGNMDRERIMRIRDLKIDFISAGSLTHSVRALDLSMKIV